MASFMGKLNAEQIADMDMDEFAEVDLAEALAFILYTTEDQDELWLLVEKLCENHESIVAKLGFLITTYFIDKNITQTKGEHYAH
jgi:hypothetical protein